MTLRGRLAHLTLAIALPLVVAACGGGGEAEDDAQAISGDAGSGSDDTSGTSPSPVVTPPDEPGEDPPPGHDDPPPPIDEPPSPNLLSRPLLPIMFRANGEGPPDYDHSELMLVADQSEGLWGNEWVMPIGEDLDYLRSRHPGYITIAYVNAGHQGSWPDTTEQPEDDRLNYVQMYRATELGADIDASATEIPCGDASEIPVSGGAVDVETALYSLDGSTASDGGFISFVRIDDEIMRVTGKRNSPPRLVVVRGTDGSAPSPHSAGDAILSPVYVKDSNPDGPQTFRDGSVRYSLNVGTRQLAAMLASDFVERFMNTGWDGAYFDITTPSFYNMVDALNADLDGITRFPYNSIDREDYTIWTRADHHDLKIGRIQSAVMASLGRVPVLTVNNNANGKWFEDGGYARRFAESNAAKIQGVDGVSLEAPFTSPADEAGQYSYRALSVWKKNVRTVADATNNALAVMPWLKRIEGTDNVLEGTTHALGYGWASLLVAWGRVPGESRAVLELWTAAGTGREIVLPDFLYYDLGEPLGDAPDTDDALKALLAGASTYRRDWSRGTVLVNPAESDDEVVVRGYVDPVTCLPATITSMPAHSYHILMLPEVCGG